MSAKDFHITDEQFQSILDLHEIEQDQGTVDLYECVSFAHTSETRIDLATYDLAVRIAEGLPDRLVTEHSIRQIIADLEPKTSHIAGTGGWVTLWKNVGLKEN